MVDECNMKTVIWYRGRETLYRNVTWEEKEVWSDTGRSSEKHEEAEEKDCSKEKKKCCSLIIWSFMQNAESSPIRVGDL